MNFNEASLHHWPNMFLLSMLAYSICAFFILGICWPLYTVRKARLPHCPPIYPAGVRSSFSHTRQADRYSASKLALNVVITVVRITFCYNYSVKKPFEALHRRDHASSSRNIFDVESSSIILFYCSQLTVNKKFHLRAHYYSPCSITSVQNNFFWYGNDFFYFVSIVPEKSNDRNKNVCTFSERALLNLHFLRTTAATV